MGRMEEAFAIFDEMIGCGLKPTAITFNALIGGFGKAGDMTSALAMYESMLFHGHCADVITFTSLIDGYCRAGHLNHGLQLWHEMNAKQVSPSAYTFSVLIIALCKVNRLCKACALLTELKGSNVPKSFLFNPVIDGLCKAGNIDEANLTVAEMEGKKCTPDRVTFTVLILGNSMKGRMSEAIGNFNKMLSIGCPQITIDSLISCLSKAGMPSEVRRIKKIAYVDLKMGVPSVGQSPHLRANEIPVAV